MSKLLYIKRLCARAGGGARSFIRWLKSRLLAAVSRKAGDGLTGADPSGDALQSLQAIMDQRKGLFVQIETASKCAYIGDGLGLSLLQNHEAELAQLRRSLTELEHGLTASLLRLSALSKPAPEPLREPRRRKFTNFREWLNSPPGVAE